MPARRSPGWPAALLLATLAACGGGRIRSTAPSAPSAEALHAFRLAVRRRFAAVPPERRRDLLGEPHRAFRLLAAETTELACALGDVPATGVLLHGDLHLGQLVLADGYAGLDDFDEAVRGPLQVDLLRFSASLLLAARTMPPRAGSVLVGLLLGGYADALAGRGRPMPFPPSLRERLAARARPQAIEALSAALKGRLRPLPEEELGRLLAAAAEQCPALPSGPPAAVGRIQAGVGSAHLDKILLLFATAEGPLWLEAKETPPHAPASCIAPADAADPDRVLAALGRYRPQLRVACRLLHDGRSYTVHPWALRYVELDPAADVQGLGELASLAGWVGGRLGRAHRPDLPDPVGLAERVRLWREPLLRAAERLLVVFEEERLRALGPAR